MVTLVTKPMISKSKSTLGKIEKLDYELYRYYKSQFRLQPMLSRPLVSFQANKQRAVYRWYKFKEAFSAALVEHLLEKYGINSGTILDPFAGSGTTLFASSARGLNAEGIELLPIGQEIIRAKKILDSQFTSADYEVLGRWVQIQPWRQSSQRLPLGELRITQNAYPPETHRAIEKYLALCQWENERVRTVLRFALLCVLESVSYTRKDGQYLRWDYRSGRHQGRKIFDKGTIPSFDDAISDKLKEILIDLRPEERQSGFFDDLSEPGEIVLHRGSCLDVLPTLPGTAYDAVLTSPPYCNRYDYTRTYALELALLGIDEPGLTNLRQQMLSCTVENRAKDLCAMNPQWSTALAAVDRQELLQAILDYLEEQRARGMLNNNGIPRMVRGYFYEMACVIFECARVLKQNAPMFMVNDNVRYAGASISVDTILSSIAEQLGFAVENILVLPNDKGNSSQQMGEHGRVPLRKCIYVWRKI